MRKLRDPERRIHKLEAVLRPKKDWRHMSLDEFFFVSAGRLRDQLFNKLGGDVREFAAEMDDETLVRSMIELHQLGLFGHSVESTVNG
jgi:hypothetical protein